MTTYIVEYRTRRKGWVPAKEFDDLDEATRTKNDCVKYEMRGTKDWRVRPKV